jgi:hypothetical protein
MVKEKMTALQAGKKHRGIPLLNYKNDYLIIE